ncbi:hypothetical protein ACI797_16785 [Geodermatophilus sp. SYSU D00691]
MIVEVVGGTEERPQVKVVDVDDLATLHLALGAVTDEEADEALREAGLGRLEGSDVGHIDVGALRAAAEAQGGGGDWSERWEGMLSTARDKGRLSADGGSLQVHVESAASG